MIGKYAIFQPSNITKYRYSQTDYVDVGADSRKALQSASVSEGEPNAPSTTHDMSSSMTEVEPLRIQQCHTTVRTFKQINIIHKLNC